MMQFTNSQAPGEWLPLPKARCALPKGHLGPTLVTGQSNELNTTRQIGEVEKMKNRLSAFRLTLTAMTATAVCLASCSEARAQNSPPPNNNAPPPPAGVAGQAPALPRGVGEVVKMYQGGIDKDVIINYVNSTALPFHLNADGIIYLHSLGLPQEITKAMIVRDGQLQQQRQFNQPNYQQQPMPGAMPPPYGATAGQPPVQVVTPTTPAPDVSGVYPDYGDYGDYGYGYPYYSGYPYYYGWPVVVGGGWGWGRGWGHGGFRGGVGGFRGGVGGFRGGGGFGGFRGGGGFHGASAGGHGGGGGGHGGGGGGHR